MPRMAAIKRGNAVKERPSVAVKGYRIPRKSAVAVCQEFSLVQIHALGIVHRDVKLDNLMLRQDGSVALIDFGIAKHADHGLGHTLQGEIVGSPYYLDPEQAAGRPVNAASDIYCLGVIFYEMLTGARA